MKTIVILSLLFFTSIDVWAQHRVHGKIINEKEQTITGATIEVIGSDKRTLSDSNGMFSLAVSSDKGKIAVRHFGYEKQVLIFDVERPEILVTLRPTSDSLETVNIVHTGYQQISKERSTGSYIVLGSNQIDKRVGSSLIERLEGSMPGLQFETRAGSKELMVRGLSTFTTTMTSPLIVVDNFPFDGDLNSINPADVESVTLLRDAAATSIWGSRAGNGVLVITRKKASGQNMAIDFRSNFKISEKPRILKYSIMNSAEFIEVERMLFEKGFFNSLLDPAVNRSIIISPVVDLLKQHQEGLITKGHLEKTLESLSKNDYRETMLKHYYQNPSVFQQYVSFGKQMDKLGFRGSVGYDRNSANLHTSNSGRTTFSQYISYEPFQKVKIDLSLDHSSSKSTLPLGGNDFPISIGGGRANLYPYAELIGKDGRASSIPRTYNSYYLAQLDDKGLMDWEYRPLEEIGLSRSINRIRLTNANVNVQYSVLNWMNLNLMYSLGRQSADKSGIYDAESFYVRDLVNLFTQVDEGNYSYPIPYGAIHDMGFNDLTAHRGRAMVNIDQQFGEGHQLNMIFGTDINSTAVKTNSFRYYGYDERTLTTVPVDQHSLFPTYNGLMGSQRIATGENITRNDKRFVSFYGNAAYRFREKYSVSGSFRKDASNIFGVNTNRRWNPLWSVGMSWELSKERWMLLSSVIDLLKIRGTFGHSGNAGGTTSTLPIIAYLNYSSRWMNNFPQAQVRSLPNADLRWEDVAMYNLAADFSLFRGILSGSFDYYWKKSTDLLADDLLDPTMGFTDVTKNVGVMKGAGFDATLNFRIPIGAFYWSSSLNLSKNRNTIVKYYGASVNGSFYTQNVGSSMRPLENRSPYPVFAYYFAGLDPENGDPQGLMDGSLSKDYSALMRDSVENLNYFGTSMAPYFGNFQTSLRWKDLEVSLQLTYKFGAFAQKQTIMYGEVYNLWRTHGDYAKRWKEPGDELRTTVPSMTYPANSSRDAFYAQSEANIYAADYIRVRDLRVSYNFDLKLAKRSSRITVFGVVNDLGLLLTKNSEHLDPEAYPWQQPRSFSFGINWRY